VELKADAGPISPVKVLRVENTRREHREDLAATEEPLELRLHGRPFAVIMRTPGHDRDLAAGFLLAEGVIGGPSDIARIEPCRAPSRSRRPSLVAQGFSPANEDSCNVLDVRLVDPSRVGALLDGGRRVVTNSSCGMCGRRTIASLRAARPAITSSWAVPASLIAELPHRLRARQSGFDDTGGLHAAALFTPDGACHEVAEDVGRHNAVDKIVGRRLLADCVPLGDHLLLVSGRTSFEIVQKAFIAGVPLVAAVSAPSSLAIDLAREAGITLLGFVRNGCFNVYSHPHRIG
jgi:FdhD protein